MLGKQKGGLCILFNKAQKRTFCAKVMTDQMKSNAY